MFTLRLNLIPASYSVSLSKSSHDREHLNFTGEHSDRSDRFEGSDGHKVDQIELQIVRSDGDVTGGILRGFVIKPGDASLLIEVALPSDSFSILCSAISRRAIIRGSFSDEIFGDGAPPLSLKNPISEFSNSTIVWDLRKGFAIQLDHITLSVHEPEDEPKPLIPDVHERTPKQTHQIESRNNQWAKPYLMLIAAFLAAILFSVST